ncbi:MAG: hypothetical protein ACI9OU_002226 [Candidatus Promineifilaceae bacterium]|jgi:hypothetical protein
MIYLKNSFFVTVITCALITNVSCVSIERNKVPDVDIVVWNKTKHRLSNAYVTFSGYQSIGGPYKPGIKKTDSSIPVPLVDKVRVVWVSSDKEERWADVDLKTIDPEKFSGKLFFILLEDGSVYCEGMSFDDFRSGRHPALPRQSNPQK